MILSGEFTDDGDVIGVLIEPISMKYCQKIKLKNYLLRDLINF